MYQIKMIDTSDKNTLFITSFYASDTGQVISFELGQASLTLFLCLSIRLLTSEQTGWENVVVVRKSKDYVYGIGVESVYSLTHWGRLTHICVSKLSILGSDNGLSPGRRQAII